MHNPFNKNDFPLIKKIHIYEKLEGTNLLAYRYHDADGNSYLTNKLRLYPVLRNSRGESFLDMWNELVQKYPLVPQLVTKNNCHLSFEIYGMRN